MKSPSKTDKFLAALGFAAALTTLIAVLLVRWHDDVAWISAVLGTASGWVAGTFASPYSKQEASTFGKVASAFAAGFLTSKVDRIFELIMSEKHQALLFDDAIIRRAMVGLTCFLISMIMVFIARQYYPIEVAPGSE